MAVQAVIQRVKAKMASTAARAGGLYTSAPNADNLSCCAARGGSPPQVDISAASSGLTLQADTSKHRGHDHYVEIHNKVKPCKQALAKYMTDQSSGLRSSIATAMNRDLRCSNDQYEKLRAKLDQKQAVFLSKIAASEKYEDVDLDVMDMLLPDSMKDLQVAPPRRVGRDATRGVDEASKKEM